MTVHLRDYSQESNLVRQADGTYVAFAQDSRAAAAINQRLRYYPSMPDFVAEQSEGRFVLTEKDLRYVEAIMLRYDLL